MTRVHVLLRRSHNRIVPSSLPLINVSRCEVTVCIVAVCPLYADSSTPIRANLKFLVGLTLRYKIKLTFKALFANKSNLDFSCTSFTEFE